MTQLFVLRASFPIVDHCELSAWLLAHCESFNSWPIMGSSDMTVEVELNEATMTYWMLRYGLGNVKKKEPALAAT